MKQLLAGLSLSIALLGMGIYAAALEVAWSSAASEAAFDPDWRFRFHTQMDQLARPICRRNNFAHLERPLVRMGQNCL